MKTLQAGTPTQACGASPTKSKVFFLSKGLCLSKRIPWVVVVVAVSTVVFSSVHILIVVWEQEKR